MKLNEFGPRGSARLDPPLVNVARCIFSLIEAFCKTTVYTLTRAPAADPENSKAVADLRGLARLQGVQILSI